MPQCHSVLVPWFWCSLILCCKKTGCRGLWSRHSLWWHVHKLMPCIHQSFLTAWVLYCMCQGPLWSIQVGFDRLKGCVSAIWDNSSWPTASSTMSVSSGSYQNGLLRSEIEEVAEMLDNLQTEDGANIMYDDILCGSKMQDLTEHINITANDTVLSSSLMEHSCRVRKS